MILVCAGAVFLSDLAGVIGIGIHHCNQFTIGGGSVLIGVPFSEVTNTNNGNLE